MQRLRLCDLRLIMFSATRIHLKLDGVYRELEYEGKISDLPEWPFYSPFQTAKITDLFVKEDDFILIFATSKNFIKSRGGGQDEQEDKGASEK